MARSKRSSTTTPASFPIFQPFMYGTYKYVQNFYAESGGEPHWENAWLRHVKIYGCHPERERSAREGS